MELTRYQSTQTYKGQDNLRANYDFIMKHHRGRSCAECGRTGDDLTVINVSNGRARWAALCGRNGLQLSCPIHGGNLGFILTSMN